jgi:hypothetical protein
MSDATVKHVQFVPIEKWRELQATADRRLNLLKQVTGDMRPWCLFCHSYDGHKTDCELAKELAYVKE